MIKVKAKNLTNLATKKSNCCLGVSLHSKNHTGERLLAAIGYINSNFDRCLIDLSDTLYVHHYMGTGVSKIEAYGMARNEGDKWLCENSHIIDSLTMPYEIVRWDTWALHPEFDGLYDRYCLLFETDRHFKQAVLNDICNFYKRRYNRDVRNIGPRFLKNSINYLLEEITCHTLLVREHHCVNVYPGKQLECYRVIQENKVIDPPYGIQDFGHIRLNLYESLAGDLKAA